MNTQKELAHILAQKEANAWRAYWRHEITVDDLMRALANIHTYRDLQRYDAACEDERKRAA